MSEYKDEPDVERLIMDAAAFEELHCEITECINKKILSHNLGVKEGANLLCEMASDAIGCLDWKTSAMKEALDYINEARRILHI